MPGENTFLDFYETTLGLPRAEGHPCAVRCGVSLLTCVVTDPDQLPSEPVSADIDTLQMRGLRYITIQVINVDAVCASLPPMCLISFARGGSNFGADLHPERLNEPACTGWRDIATSEAACGPVAIHPMRR